MPKTVTPDEWNSRAAAVGIEWIGSTPARSGVKHPARCLTCGNEWNVEPNSVTKGNGCRRCAGVARRVSAGEWARRASDVGIAWIGDEPILSMNKHAARCVACGHEWMVLPKDVARGHGCPACSGNIPGEPGVAREEWDRRAHEVGVEWVGDAPLFALTKHEARCLTCGYEWQTRPSDVHRGSGCPACVNLARITQEQWAERAAAVGIEWLGNEPVRQMERHAARCVTCGHEYEAWPNVVAKGNGCRACANNERRVSRDEWDRRADAVGVEWVGDELVDSRQRHAARCLSCGYEWEARPTGISVGEGCPACAPNAPVGAAEWDRRAAAVGIEWTGDEPVRATRKHSARCVECSYEWDTSPGGVRDGNGCPLCSGRIVLPEEWDRRAAARGLEWMGDDPILSMVKHEARCLTCGYGWKTLPAGITRFGCPACAIPGFNRTAPATVYLIRHERGPYIKIGITGADPTIRLDGWRELGWSVIATWPVPVGRDAEEIERSVIHWWRGLGATRCSRDELPEGKGWTEAIHIGVAADEPRTLEYIAALVKSVGGGL